MLERRQADRSGRVRRQRRDGAAGVDRRLLHPGAVGRSRRSGRSVTGCLMWGSGFGVRGFVVRFGGSGFGVGFEIGGGRVRGARFLGTNAELEHRTRPRTLNQEPDPEPPNPANPESICPSAVSLALVRGKRHRHPDFHLRVGEGEPGQPSPRRWSQARCPAESIGRSRPDVLRTVAATCRTSSATAGAPSVSSDVLNARPATGAAPRRGKRWAVTRAARTRSGSALPVSRFTSSPPHAARSSNVRVCSRHVR